MKVTAYRLITLAFVFGFLFAFSIDSHAADVPVSCSGNGPLKTINSALKVLNPTVPNTITVSGTCKENVVVRGFEHLTLQAKPGATINDASGGSGIVVDIEKSTDVTLQGFTINGDSIGIFCSQFSVCSINGNTVQGASVAGIQFVQSRGTFGTRTIQNNGTGLPNWPTGPVKHKPILPPDAFPTRPLL